MNNVGEELGRYGKRFVQMIWDPEPQNDEASPVWCLGKQYSSASLLPKQAPSSPPESHVSQSSLNSTSAPSDYDDTSSSCGTSYEQVSDSISDTGSSAVGEEGGWPSAFLDDFEARLWFTYRSDFPPIPRSQDPNASSAMSLAMRLKSQFNQGGFTSDTGWGCMIRSGQSMLANAMSIVNLGRDWRKGQKSEQERHLLALFADDPVAPFSIHKFVEHGASFCGKHPGEWFGPSATARCIQALTNSRNETGLRVYITPDSGDVYEDSFMSIAKPDGPAGSFHPTLLLLGIRLGLDRVTPVYWEALKSALHMPQSVGIAGGRPSSSHYFVGTQGHYFFYLDPHITQVALPLRSSTQDYTVEEINSFHTRRLRRLHIKDMDPSMLIAFLVRSEEDWKNWKSSIACVQGKPIIHVSDVEPRFSQGMGVEREGAIDEVESFDGLDDDQETVVQ